MHALGAIAVFVMFTEPASPIPQWSPLPDQQREVLRHKHYSLHIEEAHLYSMKFLARWHGRNGGERLRHW
jgi:hypothetical protein